MNLHVFNDSLGVYTLEVASRINNFDDFKNNSVVNLTENTKYTHDQVDYISGTKNSIHEYLNTLSNIDKLVFHPFSFGSIPFLESFKKKFPNAQVYWVFWSFEIYNLPQVTDSWLSTESLEIVKKNRGLIKRIIFNHIIFFDKIFSVLKLPVYNSQALFKAYNKIDFFCCLFPSDFKYVQTISGNSNMKMIKLAYLSLEKMIDINDETIKIENVVMIGHSGDPMANHIPIIRTLAKINSNCSYFLPLSYGIAKYIDIVKAEAKNLLKNIEIQQEFEEKTKYLQKLKKIGFAIINVNVQQGVGNIIPLIWNGAKVFLPEKTSTYRDLKTAGLHIFSIEKDLNDEMFAELLDQDKIIENRKVLKNFVSEQQVKDYWKNILE